MTDAVTLFGEIGGFSSFFLTFLSLFVGSIPKKLFSMSVTDSLFRTNISKSGKIKEGINWFVGATRPKFKLSLLLSSICCFT